MAMSEATEFEIGRTYFTAEGHKVELLANTTDGRMVVCALVEHDDYEGSYTGRGDVFFVDKLYAKAPRELVDAELVELRAEADKLREVNHKAVRRALDAEREVTERLAKLKKYKGLELLDDFIAGKITHFLVTNDWSDPKIETFEEWFHDRDDRKRSRGLKLLALFGDSKGELTWRVDRYGDGSAGFADAVYPCLSEEMARERMLQWVRDTIVARRAYLKESDRGHQIAHIVKLADSHGIEVPPEYRVRAQHHEAEETAKKRAELTKRAAEIATELAKLPPIASKP